MTFHLADVIEDVLQAALEDAPSARQTELIAQLA
jgi:hypothetical protein